MFDRRLIQNFDWVLLILLILIATASVINLYSATYHVRNINSTRIIHKQIYWFLIGLTVFFTMTTFNYYVLERFAYPAYYALVLLLILVLLIGSVKSGSRRWIEIGSLSFEPSELAKLSVVILLAKFFSDQHHTGQRKYRIRDLWQPAIMVAIPAFLILKQPDLGTAVIVILVSFSMMLFAGIYIKSLLIMAGSGLAAAPIIWFHLKPYQQARILTFLNPEADIQGAGYHIHQSKIAIGSGLIWGKGFLKGTQTRLHFLPEQHTDFAFSVLAEEWGFAGSLTLLALYLALILWGLKIASESKDPFGSFLAVGISALIFWQAVINIGMVTGLFPVVGIPLVLFSYGGSSIVSTMIAMGLLMNISMRRFMFQ